MSVFSWTGEVEGFTLLDVDLGYDPECLPHTRFFVNATNLLDDVHVEVVGAREVGRLLTARVQVDF